MIRSKFLVLILFFGFNSYGQSSFFERKDTLHVGRFTGTSIAVGGLWSGSMIGLSQIWYKDVEKTKWHTFDDSKNWLQMDKVGHFYTPYKLNLVTTEFYQWSGVKPKSAVLLGSFVSLGYQTTLEFFDAHSVEWGWSWSDFTANTLGTFSYAAQKLFWNEERIIPKFSYAPTPFADVRPSVLGSSFSESLLKDYNGQTYWLSFNPSVFGKQNVLPKWLCLSIGYSAHEKLVGSEAYYLDAATGREYFAQREFKLSLDIDFNHVDIRRPWLKTLVRQLNYIKVPFPTLILRNGKVLGSLTGF